VNNTRRAILKTMGAGAVAWSFSAGGCRRNLLAAESTEKKPICLSVRDLGVQFLDNPLHITGQDGATSTRLPNGDAIWLFGDTIEGPFETVRGLDLTEVVSNTASIVPAQDVTQGIKKFEYLKTTAGNRPRQMIEFDTSENKATHRLWPIHSVCVNDTIYVYYHKITMDPERDVFETFTLNGMGIARAQVGEYRFERLHAPDGTKEFWKGDQPGFGVFIERLSDGYLYLWGSFWTGMFLARTRPEAIEDLSSYEYLVAAPTLERPGTAPVWKRKFEPTAVLFDGVPNELSVAYNPYLKCHIAIHVLNRENKLAIRTSPKITGPWSEPEIFFRPQMKKSNDLFTAGKEHPELRREQGKILLVTYVNSSVYAPHLLELSLR